MNNETSLTRKMKAHYESFRQQNLKAWQPVLTPKNVISTLILAGIIFLPLGVVFITLSSNVQEIVIDYTDCLTSAGKDFSFPSFTRDFQWKTVNTGNKTLCQLFFPVRSSISGPVFLYYRLTNYYQNYRLYVKSVESNQLAGQALSFSALSNCDPLIGPAGFDALGDARPVYYPCGLVANSFFNDTIGNPISPTTGQVFNFSDANIIWGYDFNKYAKTQYSPSAIVAPPYWRDPNLVFPNGTFKVVPDLSKNERFIGWMRTAGLPTFRKLYGRLDEDLPSGLYTILIDSVFDVSSFGGTKSVVISNTFFLGGKNNFLGIAYVVVGGLFLLLGIACLVRHLVSPRPLGEAKYLSWNKEKSLDKAN